MIEVPVTTGVQLKAWREALGWTLLQAMEWYGCRSVQEWHKWEQLTFLPMTVIRRVQDFEWVRSQGYSPTPGVAGRNRKTAVKPP